MKQPVWRCGVCCLEQSFDIVLVQGANALLLSAQQGLQQRLLAVVIQVVLQSPGVSEAHTAVSRAVRLHTRIDAAADGCSARRLARLLPTSSLLAAAVARDEKALTKLVAAWMCSS